MPIKPFVDVPVYQWTGMGHHPWHHQDEWEDRNITTCSDVKLATVYQPSIFRYIVSYLPNTYSQVRVIVHGWHFPRTCGAIMLAGAPCDNGLGLLGYGQCQPFCDAVNQCALNYVEEDARLYHYDCRCADVTCYQLVLIFQAKHLPNVCHVEILF